MVKVNATIIAEPARQSALVGQVALLCDADPIKDDRLATGIVQEGGRIEFIFDLGEASSYDSPLESAPDLYLSVTDSADRFIFTSVILSNIDFGKKHPVSGDSETTLELSFIEADQSFDAKAWVDPA
jgi:hypothetical protein